MRPTQGAAENLALLQRPDSGVYIAFVQGGTWQRPAGSAAGEAQRFYRGGTPFLQRYLPFWLANLAEIEAHVGRVTVPLSNADELCSLRRHIDMVRHRLRAA